MIFLLAGYEPLCMFINTSLLLLAQDETSRAPPKISWRGNSELFVVNYLQDDQRFLKVFNTELQPLNMSEAYLNLQQPVAFMGQGQCIASCAVKNGQNQLVIFEKNCKVKAEFDLPNIPVRF